jgi:capsule polysaccharide export protein KpsE/RkpR
MMIVRSTEQLRCYVTGREDALRITSEYVEQLAEQLREARAELQQVRAEREAAFAKIKAQFDADAAAMRKELTSAIAELHQLRVDMFGKWERNPTIDRLQ